MWLCVRAAFSDECQNCLGGGDGGGGWRLRGSEENRWTALTSLQLAFTEHVEPAMQAFD